MRLLFGAVILVSFASNRASAQPPAKPNPQKPIVDLAVPYLPERVSGKFKEDKWVTMDIYRPKDGEKRPCVIFAHGGGYKEGNVLGLYFQKAVEKGYVAVNLQYIVWRDHTDERRADYEGIFPQVFYDFQAAVRFLRKNADKYGIDPNRICAHGFSAGSWLISSAAYGDAGDAFVGRHYITPAGKAALGAYESSSTQGLPQGAPEAEAKAARDFLRKEKRFLVPMADGHAAYPEYSSKLNAIVIDYFHFDNLITPDDPATITFVGVGGTSPLQAPCKKAGLDYFGGELTSPVFAGKHVVHHPSPFAPCLSADGKRESDHVSRAFEFLDEKLTADPRTAAPEFRSVGRVFAAEHRVELIAPAAETAIYYTVDGSAPTPKSARYTKPLVLTETTTIKAIGTRKGARPSGVTSAVFVKGDVPPTITGPEKLPSAKLGQPYSVTFEAKSADPPVWRVAGHVTNNAGQPGKDSYGLSLDPATGVLSGTPSKAGAYTVQIQAACNYGELADTRTYLLIVEDVAAPAKP